MELLEKLLGEKPKEKTPEENLQELFEIEKELKEGAYNKKEITKKRNKERENSLGGENETSGFLKDEIGGLFSAIIGALILFPALYLEI